MPTCKNMPFSPDFSIPYMVKKLNFYSAAWSIHLKAPKSNQKSCFKDIFDAAELLANDPKATPSESITFMGNIFTDTYTNVGRGYYYYEGSLTFPMCNEDVQWMIMEKTLTISHYQVSKKSTFDSRTFDSRTFDSGHLNPDN